MPARLDDPQTHAIAERALARLRAVSPEHARALETPHVAEACAAVAIVSDFALETLLRQPALLARLAEDDGASSLPLPALTLDAQAEWPSLLRRYRHAECVRLIWRDTHGLDTLDDTLAATTRLAETCLRLALDALEPSFAQRFGTVRDANDAPLRLVVFALGKLGGGELNFSSDIDLVYAYASEGESRPEDGRNARALAAEDYFARLGQQLAKLLDETTAEGFCHRVDLRLRPFGSAGRLALSFNALEQYFQREGRDWERYAWQKARPVAGDLDAGERFLQTLRPFVYRRYLDYGALDGLREMKATIAAEVARKDMADDIKRGPGGIREIEFLAQALQLIRGGREPALRERRLQPALRALRDGRHLTDDTAARLIEAYRFLRRLENRLQMLRDAQTQRLPEDAQDRARIAQGLGFRDWDALDDALRAHRAYVSQEFDALLAVRRREAPSDDLTVYWRALRDDDPAAQVRPDAERADALAAAGFDRADESHRALRDFARAPSVREASDATRSRLDRLMPVLLGGIAASAAPSLALRRALAMFQTILRRASYLALLDEQPAALTRLIDVLARSALLGERLAAHPLLLDELLDARAVGPLPRCEEFDAAIRAAAHEDDSEAALFALNEARQALAFRVGLATLDRRQPAEDSARQLAWLADAIVRAVYALALRELQAQHGAVPDLRFAVLGYGSLGGKELGFGSDLDLVFLYDAPADAVSAGPRPLDAPRWSARLAQKIVALLGTPTGAGHLYDIDVRLRPDGAKGLLVSTLASFEDYQRHRAWTWEHQALVRARAAAGDDALCAEFERVRAETLSQTRDPETLRNDVAAMRARMRAELDRSTETRFDLKQGAGGLVDLEFLLQYLVLRDAHAHPALLTPRDTPGLIGAAAADAALSADVAVELRQAHRALLQDGLACTLDGRARLVAHEGAASDRAASSRAAYGDAIALAFANVFGQS
ncbi:MAG: bifunctional [glutamate--ammonia ligase]-adenylyl-L-tyrosine phosphorylase/[glutamate--ammonia-ligase] adenylyltransferase [Xanthomonadaceae bacterium]|nr:bifunctional [glutamate--ammonia ligase]-adenylyl-L-tyrosine phosphorylase/[glutamate--ammonia-ligase] adenylyltransferase [Xanthomonadaceae bacterium]